MSVAKACLLGLCALLAGCTEGSKPSPLPRAGVVPPVPPKKGVDATTLYERLGREDGLTLAVQDLVKTLGDDPKTKDLSGKVRRRAFVNFLMEASVNPRPRLADDVGLSPAEWATVVPALRDALTGRGVPDADRDELLGNVEKSR